jgi:hypothetical protein
MKKNHGKGGRTTKVGKASNNNRHTSGESWGVANQSVAFTSNSGIKCVGHKPQIKHDRNMDMITQS